MKTKLFLLAGLLPGLAQGAHPGTITDCKVVNDAKSTIQIEWQEYLDPSAQPFMAKKQHALLTVSVPGLTAEKEAVIFEHQSMTTRCGYRSTTTASLAQGSWVIFGNSPDGCSGPSSSYAYLMVKNTPYGDAKLPIECHSQIEERQ